MDEWRVYQTYNHYFHINNGSHDYLYVKGVVCHDEFIERTSNSELHSMFCSSLWVSCLYVTVLVNSSSNPVSTNTKCPAPTAHTKRYGLAGERDLAAEESDVDGDQKQSYKESE